MNELSNSQVIWGITLWLTVIIEWMIPLTLWLVGNLIKYWLRWDEQPSWAGTVFHKYVQLYYKKHYIPLFYSVRCAAAMKEFSVWISPMITYFALVVISVLFIYTGSVIHLAGYALALVLIVVGPRFVIDMIKALKYNNKSGDLERIDQLQKEMDELKSKIN